MYLLEKALHIALTAHTGQLDKGGEPYILHPLRLFFSLKGQDEKIIALLHDVIEDSDITLNQLENDGFPESITKRVFILTRQHHQTYEEYIETVKQDTVATSVKLADLEDNMDRTRLKTLTPKDEERLKKYEWAYHFLTH